MICTKHVLIDKKKPFSFETGQKFVVKVANTIIGEFSIKQGKTKVLYAKGYYRGYCFEELTSNYFLDDGAFYGKAIYQVVETEESANTFGVVKTLIEEKGWYIVWSPGSNQPSQQIFVSDRQARFVAYRMSEEHQGQIFYWAKLEGHAQWGELLDE